MAQSSYNVPSLQKTLDIFEMLMPYPKGLTLTELQLKLDYPKSSLFRITQVLVDREYLQRCPLEQKFSLTKKFLQLGLSTLQEKNIIEDSLPYMRVLRNQFKDTILLGTITNKDAILLEQVLGTEPFIFMLQPGKKFNFHASVLGKCMLAYFPEKEREEMLSHVRFIKYNKNTITDPFIFRTHLEQIQKQGYAVDQAEEIDAVHCIGAPIFDQYGYPLACIWMTAPAHRLPEEDFSRIGHIFAETAGAISKLYGYQKK